MHCRYTSNVERPTHSINLSSSKVDVHLRVRTVGIVVIRGIDLVQSSMSTTKSTSCELAKEK